VINKFLPADKQLKYGKFNFTGKYSFLDVLHKLTSGEVVTNRVTVPEGYTVRRTASLLARQELADYTTFMSLCTDSSFVGSLGLPIQNLEGFLFPETYYIPYFADEKYIIQMMVDNFFLQLENVHPEPMSFDSLYGVVIMASIVEREAVFDDERPLIAGVYNKRLKDKMLLQADPTVAYALELNRVSRKKYIMKTSKSNQIIIHIYIVGFRQRLFVIQEYGLFSGHCTHRKQIIYSFSQARTRGIFFQRLIGNILRNLIEYKLDKFEYRMMINDLRFEK
jgi:Predicted periplasmic solute-binding protein